MLKILYLILFYLIYRITDLVLLLVLLIQTILNLFSGEPSQSIKEFGKSLGVYLQQISEFLSYASEEKPYPFSDWPDARTVKTFNPDEHPAAATPEESSPQAFQAISKDTSTDSSSDNTTKKEK